MLRLLIPLALILGLTSLWLIAMAEHERRAMLKRIGHMRALQEVERSFGDWPHLHEEARGGRKPGELGVIKTAPAQRLTRHSHHDGSATNL